jgi:HTH-type transcriptional regulator/antitoxin HipB
MQHLVSTPEQLSHVLRSARKALALSQDETGKLVGLLPKTISALENHPRSASVESLFKLLSALNLELSIAPKGTGGSDKTASNAGKAKHEEW